MIFSIHIKIFMITAALLRFPSYRNQVTLQTEERTRFGHEKKSESAHIPPRYTFHYTSTPLRVVAIRIVLFVYICS